MNEITLSWYLPFIPEKTENIVIQSTEILTTNEDIQMKFNEFIEYLKAEYSEANYRLLFFPDTLLPCCYIHTKHEQLKVIQESIDNFQAFYILRSLSTLNVEDIVVIILNSNH